MPKKLIVDLSLQKKPSDYLQRAAGLWAFDFYDMFARGLN